MAGFPRLRPQYDFTVLGGGHAGLQAGVKAALLHHSAVIISRGPKFSRSYYAPHMANIPGFPEGVSGHKLLDVQVAAVHQQAERVTYVTPGRATAVRRTPDGYETTFEWLGRTHTVESPALILALGVVDRIPVVGGEIKTIFPWANAALVDFCIFCDGHDLTGRSVGVIGDDAYAVRLALEIRGFEPTRVELLTHGRPLLGTVPDPEKGQLRDELARHGIPVVESEMVGFDGIREKQWIVRFADGSSRQYERGFSGLGWYDMNSEIPRSLGATFDPDGYVVTDEDCRVLAADGTGPLPGLYAVGDLRNGWNQIPEAWATAERAVIHAYGEYLPGRTTASP
jgi:thioredoxin reductase (NADPH)